jgi:hypothetical protein
VAGAGKVVAVGLLTQRELSSLGPTFARAWPVGETPCFNGLLNGIDQADRDLWRERDTHPDKLPLLQEDSSLAP